MNKRIKKKKKKQLSNLVRELKRNKSFGYYWIDNQFKFGIDLALEKRLLCNRGMEMINKRRFP